MGTTEKLRTLLDGRYPETRDRVRWWLSQPGNEPADDLPLEEHRERVLAWASPSGAPWSDASSARRAAPKRC